MTSRLASRSTLVAIVVATALGANAGAVRPVGAASVGTERIGTSAGNFLKIGVGARAVGMGEAFVAVANDPSTIYWNPAGVASTGRISGIGGSARQGRHRRG